MSDKIKESKYIPAYDGIRALALVAVVFYHLMPARLAGGYLGVVSFFVMAGYLTTRQIVRVGKKEKVGRALGNKMKDKVLKLYPPLLMMLVTVLSFLFIFLRADLAFLGQDLPTAVLSVFNYGEIFTGGSYFEKAAKLAPFTHLWALSLEFQVYLLFFIGLWGRYKARDRKKYLFTFLFLALASYLLSFYLIDGGAGFTRVYYATGTRLYSFLMGGAAALIRRPSLSLKIEELGAFTCLALSIVSFFVFDISRAVFVWVFPAYSLLIALLLMILGRARGRQARLLGSAPFSFLARRSYHIYLWHYPILVVQEKILAHTIMGELPFYLITLFLTFILSELSYQVNLKWQGLKLAENRKLLAIFALSLLLILTPYSLMAQSSQEKQALDDMEATILQHEEEQRERQKEREKEKESEEEEKLEKEDREDKKEETLPKEGAQGLKDQGKTGMEEEDFPLSYDNALEAIDWVNDLDPSLHLDPDLYSRYRRIKGLLIGDSLASMSYHVLLTYMPEILYDTEHSRQMDEALEALAPHRGREDLGDYIILSLGTNGEVDHTDIDRVRKAYKDKTLILTTVILPKREVEKRRNESIRSYADQHDGVYLVDWHQAAKDKADLFFDDQIHTGERGARILSQLIISTLIDIEESN